MSMIAIDQPMLSQTKNTLNVGEGNRPSSAGVDSFLLPGFGAEAAGTWTWNSL